MQELLVRLGTVRRRFRERRIQEGCRLLGDLQACFRRVIARESNRSTNCAAMSGKQQQRLRCYERAVRRLVGRFVAEPKLP